MMCMFRHCKGDRNLFQLERKQGYVLVTIAGRGGGKGGILAVMFLKLACNIKWGTRKYCNPSANMPSSSTLFVIPRSTYGRLAWGISIF